jgi:hypothetical protein
VADRDRGLVLRRHLFQHHVQVYGHWHCSAFYLCHGPLDRETEIVLGDHRDRGKRIVVDSLQYFFLQDLEREICLCCHLGLETEICL